MKKVKKIIASLISFVFILQQICFAQVSTQLNLGKYLNNIPSATADMFRPMQMRYFFYEPSSDSFKLLLDKGDQFGVNVGNGRDRSLHPELEESAKILLKYFLIGVTLPNDKFWVNLRPDASDQIIDPELGKTDVGRIFLETDLQLKKDTARFTSPQTPEGKVYWEKLYKKAGELLGSDSIEIPTLTRPWIVPGEVIIRQTANSAYVYKAGLKVMLEEDYIKSQPSAISSGLSAYNFKDERLKELNKYSTELIKELILPKITQEVNSSKRYANFRQVFYSLVLAQWFKKNFSGQKGKYASMIDQHDLNGLISTGDWSKDTYFKEYQASFKNGEYKLNETVSTLQGRVIRSYFSGGIQATVNNPAGFQGGMANPAQAVLGFGTGVGLQGNANEIALRRATADDLHEPSAIESTIAQYDIRWAAGARLIAADIEKFRITEIGIDKDAGYILTNGGQTRFGIHKVTGDDESYYIIQGGGIREDRKGAPANSPVTVLSRKVVAIQGIGGTGGLLLKPLLESGAIVIASDTNTDLIASRLKDFQDYVVAGKLFIFPEERLVLEGGKVNFTRKIMNPLKYFSVQLQGMGVDHVDVFSPCAIGPVVNPETIQELKAAGVKIICGSCNDVTEDKVRDPRLLKENGIIYVPDYIANAGGVTGVDGHLGHDVSDQAIAERIAARVKNIIELSNAKQDETTQTVADRTSRDFFEKLPTAGVWGSVLDGALAIGDTKEAQRIRRANPKILNDLTLADGSVVRVLRDKEDFPPVVLKHWDNHYVVFEISNLELGYTAYMAIHRLTKIVSKAEIVNGQYRATGGTRILDYRYTPNAEKYETSNNAALANSLELSQEMSFKNAGALLPIGGSKCTINVQIDPRRSGKDHEQREKILISYAQAIEEIGNLIGGGVLTGQDANITVEDAKLLFEHAPTSIVPYIAPDLCVEPTPPTGVGVFAAMTAAAEKVFGEVSSSPAKMIEKNDIRWAAGARLTAADIEKFRITEIVIDEEGGYILTNGGQTRFSIQKVTRGSETYYMIPGGGIQEARLGSFSASTSSPVTLAEVTRTWDTDIKPLFSAATSGSAGQAKAAVTAGNNKRIIIFASMLRDLYHIVPRTDRAQRRKLDIAIDILHSRETLLSTESVNAIDKLMHNLKPAPLSEVEVIINNLYSRIGQLQLYPHRLAGSSRSVADILKDLLKIKTKNDLEIFLRELIDSLEKEGQITKEAVVSESLVAVKDAQDALSNLQDGVSGSSVTAPGGIDLRAINIMIQPMGSFSGLQFNLPKIADLQGFNVDEEIAQFNRMVEGGLMPSDDRLSEIIAVCVGRKEVDKYRAKIIECLGRFCDLQEKQVIESGPGLREALVLVDVI
ncbi:MAG: hypothetical protein V1650_01960 [Candidatus Omnitrophota bacterium]